VIPTPPPPPPASVPQGPLMELPGFTGSSPVSVLVKPTASQSAIALGSVYRLQLLPLFNHFGHYTCDITLSVPPVAAATPLRFVSNARTISRTPRSSSGRTGYPPAPSHPAAMGLGWRIRLQLSWGLSRLDIIGLPLKVRVQYLSYVLLTDALISDMHPLSHDSIDVDIVLSKLNLCLHDPNFDPSTFFVTIPSFSSTSIIWGFSHGASHPSGTPSAVWDSDRADLAPSVACLLLN